MSDPDRVAKRLVLLAHGYQYDQDARYFRHWATGDVVPLEALDELSLDALCQHVTEGRPKPKRAWSNPMKAHEIEPGVWAGDYTADRDGSLLQFLDKVSASRRDGGLFHGGHIHFIQELLSDEDGCCFLKAAISAVLDLVPSVFPLDLPEIATADDAAEKPVPENWLAAIAEINAGLILPIVPWDVVRVIKAARLYLSLDRDAHA